MSRLSNRVVRIAHIDKKKKKRKKKIKKNTFAFVEEKKKKHTYLLCIMRTLERNAARGDIKCLTLYSDSLL